EPEDETSLRDALEVVRRLRQRHRVAGERHCDRRRQLEAFGVLGGEEHGQERVVRAFERVRAVVAGGLELACPVCDPAEIVRERPVDLHRFSIVAVASSGFAAAVGKAAAAAWIVGPWLNARERRERRQYADRMSEDLKPRSREVTDGMERAG